MRDISSILQFRNDISPFLVHLTKPTSQKTASEVLKNIIHDRQLRCGTSEISQIRFAGVNNYKMKDSAKNFVEAICLTETPLREVHCLLEIEGRKTNLQAYGLVFLKDLLASGGKVSPAIYLNNTDNAALPLLEALATLAVSHKDAAEELLPLITTFGDMVTPRHSAPQDGTHDFRWEREWRVPACKAPLSFTEEDVFVGLCPHDEIDEFEELFAPVTFVDPVRNMTWYAEKLIAARQRLGLKNSVV